MIHDDKCNTNSFEKKDYMKCKSREIVTIKITALLRSVRILKRVIETRDDLL